ncbi:hypothetical protein [Streptomyces mirabilis]|uniref:hypothetical protein n=1 Tax=Streptomyces mirabilis TaxID=68239 RepID=UPI0021C24511|nr:hypothetical protein [Streptomyces mirabilis]MCT9107594.1 hypothetical protein [Streptomyces mirabilis]
MRVGEVSPGGQGIDDGLDGGLRAGGPARASQEQRQRKPAACFDQEDRLVSRCGNPVVAWEAG